MKQIIRRAETNSTEHAEAQRIIEVTELVHDLLNTHQVPRDLGISALLDVLCTACLDIKVSETLFTKLCREVYTGMKRDREYIKRKVTESDLDRL